MKYANTVKLAVFSHESKDSKSILDALLKFFPSNPKGGKATIKKQMQKASTK